MAGPIVLGWALVATAALAAPAAARPRVVAVTPAAATATNALMMRLRIGRFPPVTPGDKVRFGLGGCVNRTGVRIAPVGGYQVGPAAPPVSLPYSAYSNDYSMTRI